MDSIISSIGVWLDPYAAAVIALAVTLGGLAMLIQKGAVAEPGPDQEKLLQALSVGGDLRRMYVTRLSWALDQADSLLGDADRAGSSLRSPFGNKQPAPYWTGWSFETCAVMAIAYPVLSVFATWAWNDHVGAVGRGLGLEPAPRLARIATMISVIVVWFLCSRGKRYSIQRSTRLVIDFMVITCGITFLAAYYLVLAFASGFTGAGALTFTVAGFCVCFVAASIAINRDAAGAGRFTAGVAGVLIVGIAIVLAVTIAFALADALAASIASCLFGLVILYIFVVSSSRARRRNRLGRFWVAYWSVATGICCLGLHATAISGTSRAGLLFIVMVGLVPLVNMPFDWASVGVTRALLRRGCEPGAPSPFLLGLLDLGLGLVLLVGLALGLAAALVLANDLAARPHAPALINLPLLLQQLAAPGKHPAVWWVYLTLFSTMVPSVLNCVIGAASLFTWSLPPLRSWMLATIPTLQPTGFGRTRTLILLAMGGEVFMGTLFTGIAFWGLFRVGQSVAPSALHDVLALAAVWLRALTGAG